MPTTVHQLRSILRTDPTVFIYDVRESDEFAESHVPGATHLPLNHLLERDFPGGNKPTENSRIILLCRSGKRAGVAADSLRLAGHTDVSVVEGGTLAWIAAGFPLGTGLPAHPAPPEFP